MSDHAAEHEHHDHTMHYVKIWAILLVLLFLSVIGPVIGEVTGIQAITLITAFGIACVKAAMVMKYFMHLDKEMKMVWYILSGAFILIVLMFFGVAADVMNHEGSRWVNTAAKAEVERGMAAGSGHGEHGAEHDEGHAGDKGHKEEGH